MPTLREVIDLKTHCYLVTLPPVGNGDDVYALRPLVQEVSGSAPAGDAFWGKAVLWAGKEYRIGALAGGYLVRVGEPAHETKAA